MQDFNASQGRYCYAALVACEICITVAIKRRMLEGYKIAKESEPIKNIIKAVLPSVFPRTADDVN